MRYARNKVGKGNRKVVRNLLRQFGIELPFGRDCVNNRYSLKIYPIHSAHPNAEKSRDALVRKINNILAFGSTLINGSVEVIKTNRECSYPRGTQFGIALRFEDI